MKTWKRIVLPLVIALATASLGFSQSGSGSSTNTGSGSSSTSNSNSDSKSGANAVINMGSGKANFIEALPGSTGGVIPGPFFENEGCRPVYLAAERTLTMNEVRSYAKDAKGKIYEAIGDPHAIPANDDDVEFAPYNPEGIAWPEDRVLGHFIAEGKHLRPGIGDLARAILKAKKETGTRRISVQDCPESALKSKQFNGGVGGVFSSNPGGGDSANGASAGLNFGTSTTRNEKHDVYYVLAMNDWPENRPHTVPHDETPPPPPPPPAEPAPKPHVEEAPAPTPPQPTPQPSAPTGLTATVTETTPSCNAKTMPQVTVYFKYDKYDVVPPDGQDEHTANNLASILTIERWAEDNPNCNIDVEGYASLEGTPSHNWTLAGNRAGSVYDILIKDEKIKDQLPRFLSGGKNFHNHFSPNRDLNWEDRRVIFTIRTETSGR